MKALLTSLALMTASAQSLALQYACRQNGTNVYFSTEKLSFGAMQKCWSPCYMSGGSMTKISDSEYRLHLDSGFVLVPLLAIDMKIYILQNNSIRIEESGTFDPQSITFENCTTTEESKEAL